MANTEPMFTTDILKLFLTPFLDRRALHFPWANQDKDLDFEFLRAVFFVNKVPIEEHIFTIPQFKRHGIVDGEAGEVWWGHPHMKMLLNKLSIKFYGC